MAMIAFHRAARILLLGSVISSLLLPATKAENANELLGVFENPPPAARPWVFWYWNKGAISREGITADLEAMHDAGLGGAYLMTIKGPDPKLWDPSVVQLTPQWWEMIRHAFNEADRLKLQLAMHACDGFATAGGPWITPERSMQQVVWSETRISGPEQFEGALPQPETNEGFYRDIAVFALPDSERLSTQTPTVVTSMGEDAQFLAEPENERRIRMDEPAWIQYQYSEPFTCCNVTIRPDGNSFQANRLLVTASLDGEKFRPVARLEPPRHGWQNGSAIVTHAIPPTTARIFRFVYDPEGTEPGAEDLDSAKWKPSLKVRGIHLSGRPRLHQFESKNGTFWRVSRRTTTEQLADGDCIPFDKIIDITKHLQRDGTLDWQAPDGGWLVLRMGHTSTGTHNETGGGGRGLECDKFDAEVVRLQFDRWFGEVIRQVGPELAGKVLKVFHVDSWECGSQNWSTVFPDEFRRRRGYDLLPYLPVLAGIPIDSADISERVLHDVRQTIAELVSDSFFATLAELAHDHDCKFSAECVAPTMVSDGLRHFGIVDIPMGEFWLRSPTHDKPNDMHDAISAGHVYGKRIIQAEAFTQLRMDWDEHPGILKALGDRQLALGANRLVYHVFNHNPWMDYRPGMTLDAIGLYFQREQTWWPAANVWTNYHARCQAMLQSGTPVVDVAVFTGEEVPSRAVLPETLVTTLPGIMGMNAVKREQKRLTNQGIPQREMPRGVTASANITDPNDWIDSLRGYSYDSVNADALCRLAEVKEGNITFPGGANYQLLVMPMPRSIAPHPELLSPALATKLGKLVEAGATIVACVHGRHSPSLSNFPSADQQLLEILGEPPPDGTLIAEKPGSTRQIGAGRLIYGPIDDDSFSKWGIEPDFLCFSLDGQRLHNVAWNHRRSKNADWYFLSSQSSSSRLVNFSFRIAGKVPEIWDPLSGEIRAVSSWGISRGRTVFTAQLYPGQSMFVVFRHATESKAEIGDRNWMEFTDIQSLASAWTVHFEPGSGGPAEPVEFASLTDWSKHEDEKVRHYSGSATYRQVFDGNETTQPVWLDLGDVANVAHVRLNDIDCGVAWTFPYRVKITDALRDGQNKLEITVTNTWANRLIGDAKLPADKRLTRMTAPYPPVDAALLKAGLLGPVKLVRASVALNQSE